MPQFTFDLLENRALYNCALAFNEQLPIGGNTGTRLGDTGIPVPKAVKLLPNGNALLQYYAPNAKCIAARLQEKRFLLQKDNDGFWRSEIPYDTPGFKALFFEVDGTDVLNPLAPIGFGYSQPINFIEFPEENCDFYLLKDVPHGTVAEEFYFSAVTGQYESCMLYLPPTYMSQPTKNYPVLYLQHGHGENERCWLYQGKVNFIMDNLLAQQKASPCIIVMNNGMVHSKNEDGDVYMNSALLERVLINDCIPFIEKKYHVRSDKKHRAMAGLSMGSMQTSIITMNHPELFDYVGIFSGFLRSLMENANGNSHLKALDNTEDFRTRYKIFMRAIGTEDGFRSVFEEESRLMEEKELSPDRYPAHKIYYYPGGHEWQVWRKCIHDFLQLIFI